MHQGMVLGVAFNCKGACGNCLFILSVADDCGEQFKGWYIGSHMIATVHSMLVVVSR